MQFLRKLLLGLSLALYLPLLLTLPTLVSLNATIINPNYVKGVLAESKIYHGLSEEVVNQAKRNEEAAQNEIVILALKEAATPAALQEIFEPTLDSVYTWLDNPQGDPNITVALKPLQDKFKVIAEQKVQERLAGLPRCKTLPATTDSLSLDCLPPGTSSQQLLEQAKTQLSQNVDLLGEQGTISLTDPKPKEQANTEGQKLETPSVDFTELRRIAMLYNWVKIGLPIIATLLGLATLAIILLSRPWVKSLKRISIFALTAGALLFVTSFVTSILLRMFLRVPATGGALSVAGEAAANLIANKVLQISSVFAFSYLGAGVVLLIAYLVLRKKFGLKAEKNPAIEKDDMLPKHDKELESKEPEPTPEQPKEESSKETKINVS